jgi:hypothetical protein
MQVVRNAIGLIALTVEMIACSDATKPTSPLAGYEGAKVSLTGTSIVAVPTLDGKIVAVATRQWAEDAVVTKGLADASRSKAIEGGAKMPVLFLGDDHVLAQGRANSRLFMPGSKSTGDFVVVNGEAGPARSIVHLDPNGQVDQAFTYEWKRVAGGWKAISLTLDLFQNGKPLIRFHSTAKPVSGGVASMIAADDPCWTDPNCDPADGVPDGGGAGSGGAIGGGTTDGTTCCKAELAAYIRDSAVLATATEAAKANGTILDPYVALGLLALASFVSHDISVYQNCYYICTHKYASGYRVQPGRGFALVV